MKDEEKKLVERARSGESAAFGELYDRYVRQIYRFVFIKVGTKQDAEDITQQVFVNAWQNVKNFEFKGFPFSSWLYRIASNAVVDHYRVAGRTVDIEQFPEDVFADDDGREETEDRLDKAMDLATVRKHLASLEPDQQSVLVMKFVDDLPNKDIAEALGKTEGAVRVIQHRALKILKSKLETENGNHA